MGRCTVALPQNPEPRPDQHPYPIPEGVRVVAIVAMHLLGQDWLLLDGPSLPGWKPGELPHHFTSLASFRDAWAEHEVRRDGTGMGWPRRRPHVEMD